MTIGAARRRPMARTMASMLVSLGMRIRCAAQFLQSDAPKRGIGKFEPGRPIMAATKEHSSPPGTAMIAVA